MIGWSFEFPWLRSFRFSEIFFGKLDERFAFGESEVRGGLVLFEDAAPESDLALETAELLFLLLL